MARKLRVDMPYTEWSKLARAGHDKAEIRSEGLNYFVRTYLPALRAYLVECLRLAGDDADEVLQGFITEKVLERNLIGKARPQAGKFRCFLLVSLRNYLANSRRRGRKDVPILDSAVIEQSAVDNVTPPIEFDRAWARSAIRQALSAMKAELARRGRTDQWEIFYGRVVGPTMDGLPKTGYAEMGPGAARMTSQQAANCLVNAKRTFARHLRRVVKSYSPGGDGADDEVAYLRSLLSLSE